MTHSPDPSLFERPINILIVGCGGNGSSIAGGLPYLDQGVLAFGHPGGLNMTLIDPDAGSETNCVRQPFCRTEIELCKAIVSTHRANYLRAESGFGAYPVGGVIFGSSGELLGVMNSGYSGSNGKGMVYQLSQSSLGWIEQTLYSFTGQSDGEFPIEGLTRDSMGNVYGTTSTGGIGGGGTVFELSSPNGVWNFSTIYSFIGDNSFQGPYATLRMDAAGNLHGTTAGDGIYGKGSAFKLTPSQGGWGYTTLHDFTGVSDGQTPRGSVFLDENGNIFGTAGYGGNSGVEVVFEITP